MTQLPLGIAKVFVEVNEIENVVTQGVLYTVTHGTGGRLSADLAEDKDS